MLFAEGHRLMGVVNAHQCPITMPQPSTSPVPLAAASPTDPAQNAARPAVSSEALDACPEQDVCIDQYLWSLYERTQKVDTVKVEADQGEGQEQGQDADCHQNSDEVRYRGLRMEGSESRAESRHVAAGLRDRRHRSRL